MAGKQSITILHVSDMQFGRHHEFPEQDLPRSELDTLLGRICKDIDQLRRAEHLEPDLLICTGDLAEWAWKKEFDDAMEFLSQLAERLEIKRDRVVIIPGNHDVHRRDCESYFKDFIEGGDPVVAPWYPKWKKYEAAFSGFYKNVPGATFHEGQPWSLFCIPALEVVVAGLNSTWIEGHDWPADKSQDHLKEEHRIEHAGWCGEEQLEWFANKLSEDEFRGCLKIGAVHHNLQPGRGLKPEHEDKEYLRDAADFERILGPHLDIVLHGHTHRARWNWVRDLFPWFATGSAGVKRSSRPYGVPNQYQFLVLKPKGVRVRARYYLPDPEKKWANDSSIGDDFGVKEITVGWRNVRRFVQDEKLLSFEEFLLEYHKGLSRAAAAAQAALLAENPEPNIDLILTMICVVVKAWCNKRDKPELEVYANYQMLREADKLTMEEEESSFKIGTGGGPTHYLVAKSSSWNEEPPEKLALEVDFAGGVSAALPGSPMAVISGRTKYIDDTHEIAFGEGLSPETKERIKLFFEKHYTRFKSCASFVLRNVGAPDSDERKKAVGALNVEASERWAFGETPEEKEKTYVMLLPLICMLETAIGSRTLRETLEKRALTRYSRIEKNG
jgi:3',5'-cyclic AMP phosphodiesterase CpdA